MCFFFGKDFLCLFGLKLSEIIYSNCELVLYFWGKFFFLLGLKSPSCVPGSMHLESSPKDRMFCKSQLR